MKSALSILAIILIIISCDDYTRSSQYIFSVYNSSSDTITACIRTEGRAKSYFGLPYACSTIYPNSIRNMVYYAGEGYVVDYWSTGEVVVIDEVEIYVDSLLVDKDFLQRSYWEYNKNRIDEAEYRLFITDAVLD
ncbi:MAG: hypothetical protein ABJG41_03045 [Cyclobacteriaceae bacterium]